jgi:hypothetical protein
VCVFSSLNYHRSDWCTRSTPRVNKKKREREGCVERNFKEKKRLKKRRAKGINNRSCSSNSRRIEGDDDDVGRENLLNTFSVLTLKSIYSCLFLSKFLKLKLCVCVCVCDFGYTKLLIAAYAVNIKCKIK